MKRFAFAGLLLMALTGAHPGTAQAQPAQPRPAASLCRAQEVVLFTCEMQARTVSICGHGQGGAIYRFGRPGRTELEATNLHRADSGFSGGGETQVYADTPTHRYIVYDRMVRTGFGADGHFDPKETSGLVVQSEGRTVSSRECTLPATFGQPTRTLVPAGDYVPH